MACFPLVPALLLEAKWTRWPLAMGCSLFLRPYFLGVWVSRVAEWLPIDCSG